MKIKGAIFDLDGTLLDSMHAWEGVGERYLKSKNIAVSPEFAEEIKKMSLVESCAFVKTRYGLKESTDEILSEILHIVGDFYTNEAKLKPGVKEFLTHLGKSGVKLCVATATDKALAENALERNGVLELFDFVLTCGEAKCNKETADIYNLALERLGTEKENTFVFEDAYHAAESAKKGGFFVCGVYDESENLPVESISDVFIKSYFEVGDYFD